MILPHIKYRLHMKNLSKYLAVLPLVLGGITLSFVLAISVWSVTGNKPLFQTQSKASSEEVSLSFSPNSGKWQVGKSQSLGIILSTGTKLISGVDLTVKYDPTLVSIASNSVVSGKLLENVLVSRAEPGKISFSAVTLSPASKNGILLTLIFVPIKSGQLNLTFESPSDVMESPSALNILNKKTNAQFDIQ